MIRHLFIFYISTLALHSYADPRATYESSAESFLKELCVSEVALQCANIAELCEVTETKNICILNTLYQYSMDSEQCESQPVVEECKEKLSRSRDSYVQILQEQASGEPRKVREAAWACEKTHPNIDPRGQVTRKIAGFIKENGGIQPSYVTWGSFYECFLKHFGGSSDA